MKSKKTADAKAPAQYANMVDVIKYHQPYKFCIVDCSHYGESEENEHTASKKQRDYPRSLNSWSQTGRK